MWALFFLLVYEKGHMKSEEYKGFLITEAPGLMFKATIIKPSAHFSRPFNACTVKSLKILIDYENKKKKSTIRKKPVRYPS